MTDVITIIEQAKARRRAQGLVSVYDGLHGPLEIAHPSEAHKRFHDLKYALRAEYGKTSAAPKERLAELDALRAALSEASSTCQ